jgi:hypothetical protein
MFIEGPVYLERVEATLLSTEPDVRIQAHSLANAFGMRMLNGRPDFVFRWDVEYVDSYASKHVEKWVEKIGLHFWNYTSATEPPSVQGGRVPAMVSTPGGRVQLLKLSQKVFSGDVSGSIGEALLATLLRRRYGLTSRDFVHLRATKNTGRAPDFYITKITRRLADDLDPTNPATIKPPITAEVKGATSFSLPGISSKFENALSQVQALRRDGGYGLAAVFLRVPQHRSYHGLIVVVRP